MAPQITAIRPESIEDHETARRDVAVGRHHPATADERAEPHRSVEPDRPSRGAAAHPHGLDPPSGRASPLPALDRRDRPARWVGGRRGGRRARVTCACNARTASCITRVSPRLDTNVGSGVGILGSRSALRDLQGAWRRHGRARARTMGAASAGTNRAADAAPRLIPQENDPRGPSLRGRSIRGLSLGGRRRRGRAAGRGRRARERRRRRQRRGRRAGRRGRRACRHGADEGNGKNDALEHEGTSGAWPARRRRPGIWPGGHAKTVPAARRRRRGTSCANSLQWCHRAPARSGSTA